VRTSERELDDLRTSERQRDDAARASTTTPRAGAHVISLPVVADAS
jgi:hypothetical protein